MNRLYPDDYVDSVYEIDFEKLYRQGYRGLIFDVDNTLVPHGAPADERALSLFQRLNATGFRSMFVSNNREPRVQSFCDAVGGFGYLYRAGKPNPKGYREAMQRMGTDERSTLFLGDQIFTDILGANRAGIRSVMVRPVLKWREEIQIIFKRFAEAVVLFFYRIYVKSGGAQQPVPLLSEAEKKSGQ